MKEISIKDIENIQIGQYEDPEAMTGCTVVICKKGMEAGIDIRGGGPASRDVELLKPLANAHDIHAILLSGGSAFGLDAAGGVMQYLEENGVGYQTGFAQVPLVCQSDIYDLGVGSSKIRPGAEMGYLAAKASEEFNYKDGHYGVGCGATVGKYDGIARAMRTGIGSYAVQIGGFKMGAIVVVNAYGDVFDYDSGKELAGHLSEDLKSFEPTEELMYRKYAPIEGNRFTDNTTLAVVICNGSFSKVQLEKMAGMAHNGYARTINPVHTSADGDSIYAVSVGNLDVDLDMAGTLSSLVVGRAVSRAVKGAVPAAKFQSKDTDYHPRRR